MPVRYRNTGRPQDVIAIAPRSVSRRLRLYAQHIGEDDWYLPDNTTTTKHVLTREPVPASLANADDYIEAAVTATSSTLAIDQRFYLADLIPSQLIAGGVAQVQYESFVFEGTVRVVARVGAKGDGTYNTYIDRIVISLEKVDDQNNYTSIFTKDITLSTPLSNSSTSWQTWDWQILRNVDRTLLEPDKQLVLRIQIYAYMDSGGTDQAVRLYITRGSQDTFVDLLMDEI